MTDTELSAIRARAEAATPGPWILDDEGEYICNVGPLCDEGDHWSGNDTFFVTHARTDIPALLAHIDEQREEIEHLKRALNWLENRTLRVDDFAAPCQCEERHNEDTECAFGEIPEQCCPKYNVLGTGTCWVQEALDATKEEVSE